MTSCFIRLPFATASMNRTSNVIWLVLFPLLLAPTLAQEVKRPRVFLDKNPRIVAFQLKRLSNEQLLLVERATDHEKYKPVFAAILSRAGMSRKDREDALSGLVVLNNSNVVTELLGAVAATQVEDAEQLRVAQQLAAMLLQQRATALQAHQSELVAATTSTNSVLRATGYAGLIVAGSADTAWKAVGMSPEAQLDYLHAVSLIPRKATRATLRARVATLFDQAPNPEIKLAAIRAFADIPAQQRENFQLVAECTGEPALRTTAVRTLLTIPAEFRPRETAAKLVDDFVTFAEDTPAAERTTDDFVDVMQLTDQLMGLVPAAAAKLYRKRLDAVTVRVVRINTVEEEMRYDLPYFAVEAGREVQIVLHNDDLMPHNFVVTVPDALQEVALAGAAHGPAPGKFGHPYVPESDQVLYATGMVPPHRRARLTFKAPDTPGEYPYVCTFPRHWMRMYGVMVVVPDLNAWQQSPTKPKDPIGSNRAFVANWKLEDLQDQISAGLQGRSPKIGARIFTEATCAQCHKFRGQGGAVGPELTEVYKRFKNVDADVLREVLDPSHRIDPKYAVRVVVTDEGQVFSGIVASEDRDQIALIVNPEAKQPQIIQKDEIDEMVKSSKSMMPKALLDRFTKDEIFELLSYLKSGSSTPSAD
ncbi:MAG: hypothetical protein CL681_25260 [Blastopirellula sp.]|nr:hypothetical protein [Blastopirellula sp.]